MRLRQSSALGRGCFTVVPVALIAIGGLWLFFSIQRVSNQTTTVGVVVDVTARSDSDGTTYRPIIEFTTLDGATYRFEGRTGSSSRPRIGDTIEVLYDPADPPGATEKTFSNLWLFPLAFGGFGLLFLVFMGIGRSRAVGWGRSRRATMLDGDEAAAALDTVLERLPDVGPAGPADSGPLSGPDDGFAMPMLSSDGPVPTQERAPVGGTTAEFRRAEASISPDGTLRYRIVAKDDAGNEYYSDLLDEDPTVAIMEQGNQVKLVRRRTGWVVEFSAPADDDD